MRNLFLIAMMMVLILISGCGTSEDLQSLCRISFYEGNENATLVLHFTGRVRSIKNETGVDLKVAPESRGENFSVRVGERKVLASVPDDIYFGTSGWLSFTRYPSRAINSAHNKNFLMILHPFGSEEGEVQFEICGGKVQRICAGVRLELNTTEDYVCIGTLETGSSIDNVLMIPFSLTRGGYPVLEVRQLPDPAPDRSFNAT